MRKAGIGITTAAAAGVIAVVFLAARAGLSPANPVDADERPGIDVRAVFGDGPHPGDACTVYIRGDATGTALSDRIAGVGNLESRSGTVVRGDGQWFVVRQEDKDVWIPRASIALIEVARAPAPAAAAEDVKKEEPAKKDTDRENRGGLDLR